jgi:hypothetical protein
MKVQINRVIKSGTHNYMSRYQDARILVPISYNSDPIKSSRTYKKYHRSLCQKSISSILKPRLRNDLKRGNGQNFYHFLSQYQVFITTVNGRNLPLYT